MCSPKSDVIVVPSSTVVYNIIPNLVYEKKKIMVKDDDDDEIIFVFAANHRRRRPTTYSCTSCTTATDSPTRDSCSRTFAARGRSVSSPRTCHRRPTTTNRCWRVTIQHDQVVRCSRPVCRVQPNSGGQPCTVVSVARERRREPLHMDQGKWAT